MIYLPSFPFLFCWQKVDNCEAFSLLHQHCTCYVCFIFPCFIDIYQRHTSIYKLLIKYIFLYIFLIICFAVKKRTPWPSCRYDIVFRYWRRLLNPLISLIDLWQQICCLSSWYYSCLLSVHMLISKIVEREAVREKLE